MIKVEGDALVTSKPKILKYNNSFYCVFQLLSIEEVEKTDKVVKTTVQIYGRCWDSSATAFVKTVNKGNKIRFTGVLRKNEHNETYIRLTSFEVVDANQEI